MFTFRGNIQEMKTISEKRKEIQYEKDKIDAETNAENIVYIFIFIKT